MVPAMHGKQFDGERLRRVRRIAGAWIALTGLLNLLSAITPPLRGRFQVLHDFVPISVPETASAIVAAAGVALLLLSRSVRRGQRHAWMLAIALVGLSGLLHVVKGLDLEEAVASALVIGYLVARRDAFRAARDVPSAWRALSMLATGAAIAIATGTVTALWLPRSSHMPIWRAFEAVAERLVGITSIAIPGRRDRFLTTTLAAVGLMLGLAAVWLVLRPVVHRPHTGDRDCARARQIVAQFGGDTLGYFALRDDKHHWIWEDTLIAYVVINGVCLVSPDPVGPADQRGQAWREYRAYADAHGWSVAVMGASEAWLPIYRASGLNDLYIGDEAIVDVRPFSLEGGKNKGLRQAVNRIAKKGYTIAFFDPSELDPSLEASLRELMTESRRGHVERGFSMTLGRVFSPRDKGLLLAVCFGPDGEPAAFCQFVPAPEIEGWSLDLMRRSERSEHWNGVTDFVVVRTIEHLRELGCRGLGLNFSVMRSVLADEDPGLGQRIERRLLGWLSESMQIESLWYYNAKFHPEWVPRYAVYDSVESFIPAALAVAKAESFWELPLIGRFLTPDATPDEAPHREPTPV
jgi:lysyl-tRNA synthetase class 2